MKLEIKGLYKDFDDVSLFRDFSINIPEGKITCILGPSGCGKTTLLNIIGNIIQPDRGELEGFNQKVISYIFQDPRLLPWKTVKGNIEFVINKDLPGVEREELASRFPVRIDAHKKVEVPIANRSLDSAYLKELKQMLLHALGK
jgi:NitT/TauT family transport system ATP-binding protein